MAIDKFALSLVVALSPVTEKPLEPCDGADGSIESLAAEARFLSSEVAYAAMHYKGAFSKSDSFVRQPSRLEKKQIFGSRGAGNEALVD